MKGAWHVFAAAVAIIGRGVDALAATDSISDADPAQSGYLPHHNMDPAVVGSASFGQLWKVPFNNKEKVRPPPGVRRLRSC